MIKIMKKFLKRHIKMLIIYLFISGQIIITHSLCWGQDNQNTGPKVKTFIEMPPPVPAQIGNDLQAKQLDLFLEVAELFKLEKNPLADETETVEATSTEDENQPEINEDIPFDEIASTVRKAAELEPDECARQYYESLASFLSMKVFYTPAPQWANLENSGSEILFMPNHKGDFFPVVFLNDGEKTAQYREFSRRFGRMLDYLPYKVKPQVPYTSFPPEIKIAQLVYSPKALKLSVVYPYPEIFMQSDSNKFNIVIFENIAKHYVDCILSPIAQQVLSNPVLSQVDSNAYLANTVLFRIAHHLGPIFTTKVKSSTSDAKDDAESDESELMEENMENPEQEQNMDAGYEDLEYEDPDLAEDQPERGQKRGNDIFLKEKDKTTSGKKQKRELVVLTEYLGLRFPIAEELKARALALNNIALIVEEGLCSKEDEAALYTTYLITLMDHLRTDSRDPLLKAHISQFNYLLNHGAISFNINDRKLIINYGMFPVAAKNLAELILNKFNSATLIVNEYGTQGPELEELLKRISWIPSKIILGENQDQ